MSISHVQEWAVVPQFYLVIPLRSIRMDVMRVVYIWRIRMDVHNKKNGGFLIKNLDTISEVCSM